MKSILCRLGFLDMQIFFIWSCPSRGSGEWAQADHSWTREIVWISYLDPVLRKTHDSEWWKHCGASWEWKRPWEHHYVVEKAPAKKCQLNQVEGCLGCGWMHFLFSQLFIQKHLERIWAVGRSGVWSVQLSKTLTVIESYWMLLILFQLKSLSTSLVPCHALSLFPLVHINPLPTGADWAVWWKNWDPRLASYSWGCGKWRVQGGLNGLNPNESHDFC